MVNNSSTFNIKNNNEREELLKKLGIREPSEEEIHKLINFENEGLDKLKNEVYEKLDFFLSAQDGIRYYNIDVNSKIIAENKILVDYIVRINCKKFLGMINKVSLNHLKKGIERIIGELLRSYGRSFLLPTRSLHRRHFGLSQP
ncbi:DUF2226 domain-containing protein [Methanothermococcus sp.]|uniref:DUF2226 domain-containing protein n=1 Tax=Methanothermococcus sp. TaxID=2614238 RepID=UPI0025FD1EA0|nr:DUF2226 domain-containing protein [Methanothermococcus sp.]